MAGFAIEEGGEGMGKMEINQVEQGKYQAGKRKFWIYVVSSTVSDILMNRLSGNAYTDGILWDVLFDFLLYRGYMWVWYYEAVMSGVLFVLQLIATAIFVWGWNWVVYVYSPAQIAGWIFAVATSAGRVFALNRKKELKYFAKVNQLVRKRKLVMPNPEEITDEEAK